MHAREMLPSSYIFSLNNHFLLFFWDVPQVCKCTHVHMCGGQRLIPGIFISHSPLYEAGSLAGLARSLVWVAIHFYLCRARPSGRQPPPPNIYLDDGNLTLVPAMIVS